jgi:hypothetical protein
MQISPSAALFQALSSLNQPQGAQAHGADAAPFGKAAKQAAQAETPQAIPAPQTTEAEVRVREPAPGETPGRGSLLDLSA